MTIQEARKLGVGKVRKPIWTDPQTYLDISEGVWGRIRPGPMESRAFTPTEIEALPPMLLLTLEDDDFDIFESAHEVEQKPQDAKGE